MARKLSKKIRLGLYATIVFLLGFIGNSTIKQETTSQKSLGNNVISTVHAESGSTSSGSPTTTGGEPCPDGGGPCW